MKPLRERKALLSPPGAEEIERLPGQIGGADHNKEKKGGRKRGFDRVGEEVR